MSAVCWACGTPAKPTSEFAPARFQRCPACGLRFQTERSASELQELYGGEYFESFPGKDRPYGADLAERRHEAQVRLRYVRRWLGGGRLLEVGAAEGHFLEVARDAGFDVFGIEPAPEAARAGGERAKIEIVTGFIEDVELPQSEFDSVCAWHVLEHIAEPAQALTHIRETLAPGGYLFAEVPNAESVLARRAGADWPHLWPEHHVAQYGPRSLRALLERGHFEVVDMTTVPFFRYYRPAARVRPRMIAAHVRESASLRTLPFRAHPTKHELLRAVARI